MAFVPAHLSYFVFRAAIVITFTSAYGWAEQVGRGLFLCSERERERERERENQNKKNSKGNCDRGRGNSGTSSDSQILTPDLMDGLGVG